jgi:hypothetical protein
MIFQKIFFCIALSVLVVPVMAFAISDDFTITTIIGGDVTGPTTPILQSVVPVSSTQIDITWSASADDVLLSGYRLFRDAVQIATTTLLSYSDTGLTPSTTYQYTVDAFDYFGNISSSSPAISTTTLQNIVPPTPTSSPSSQASGGTRVTAQLIDLRITLGERDALFDWEASYPAQYVLVWGRTTEYELGSVSGNSYLQKHNTRIDALEPGSIYFYELRAINNRGILTVLSTGNFKTKSSVIGNTLPNVQGFVASTENEDVALSWQNNFSNSNYYVRVVRSHLFYPGTIFSGAVVYEGKGQSFIDRDALFTRSPQYYTIFVLDGTGAVSSGAVARADKNTLDGSQTPDMLNPTTTIPIDIGDETILNASDIAIIQNDTSQIFDEGIILDTDISYLVSIPYDTVPKNLKSIIVTVQNPTNQRESSAYLLKLNQAGDAYIASIPGANAVGTIRMMVEVFDYEQATVRRISTTVTFVDAATAVPFFPDRLIGYLQQFLAVLLLSLVCFWFIVMWRRRKKTAS